MSLSLSLTMAWVVVKIRGSKSTAEVAGIVVSAGVAAGVAAAHARRLQGEVSRKARASVSSQVSRPIVSLASCMC
ncbi:hypothetical protein ACLKA6_001871 [Drosophila palustris]